MSCWERLGIAPTEDLGLIRSTFAAQSRGCHPEDDPEGFAALREAYRMAMHQAGVMRARREAGVAEGLPQDKVPQAVTATEVPAPQPETRRELQNENAKADELRFDGLEEQIYRQKSMQQQYADQVLAQLRALCMLPPGKRPLPQWRLFFDSPDYLSLRRDAYFTLEALEFLGRPLTLPAGVVDQVLVPALREWQLLWNGTPLWNRFGQLIARWETADAMAKRNRGWSKPGNARLAIGVLVAIAIILGVTALARGTAKPSNARPAVAPAVPVYNPAAPSPIELSVTGLSEVELSWIRVERQLRDALWLCLEQGLGWETAKPAAEQLGMAEKQYDELVRMHREEGEDAARAALEEHRPAERKAIEEKLHPILMQAVQGDAAAQIKVAGVRKLLGMSDEEYKALQSGYAKKGEEWLEKAVAEWDRLEWLPAASESSESSEGE